MQMHNASPPPPATQRSCKTSIAKIYQHFPRYTQETKTPREGTIDNGTEQNRYICIRNVARGAQKFKKRENIKSKQTLPIILIFFLRHGLLPFLQLHVRQ